MPIKSYIAIPNSGQKEILRKELSKIKGCEITSAENKDVLVVVTETSSEAEDKKLFKRLNEMKPLQLLTLVAAFSNESQSNQL